jgi:glycosyltransferase involved in cell wall biosynthesis
MLFFMITVVILTKNSQEMLEKVLNSVKAFSEVLLFDSDSTDNTFSIAQKFSNVSLKKAPKEAFSNFGTLRNLAAKEAKNDWILALDADEILSSPLQNEILSLSLEENCVYDFPFHNYYHGKLIKWCGWYGESHVRLYHRKNTSFSPTFVHEKILTKNLQIQHCKNPILHYSYRSISDFLQKMQVYSTLFAKEYQGKKNASFFTALTHGMGTFCKSYLLKRGFLGGKEGFIISFYMASTAFYKYLKLQEANRQNP